MNRPSLTPLKAVFIVLSFLLNAPQYAAPQDLATPKVVLHEAEFRDRVRDLIHNRKIELGEESSDSLLADIALCDAEITLDGNATVFFLHSYKVKPNGVHDYLCVIGPKGEFLFGLALQSRSSRYRYSAKFSWRANSIALSQYLNNDDEDSRSFSGLRRDSCPTAWEVVVGANSIIPLSASPQFVGSLQRAVAASNKSVTTSATTLESWKGEVVIEGVPFTLRNTQAYASAKLSLEHASRADVSPADFLNSQRYVAWKSGRILEVNDFTSFFPERNFRLLELTSRSVKVVKTFDDDTLRSMMKDYDSDFRITPGFFSPVGAIPFLAVHRTSREIYCASLDPELGTIAFCGPLKLEKRFPFTNRYRSSPNGRFF